MTREEAIESFKRSNEQAKLRLEVERMRMESGEVKELEFYIERDEMAIQALEQTRWIPVSERLPKTTDYYLVSVGINEYGVGMIRSVRTALYDAKTKDFTIHTGTNMCIVGDVVAWCDCVPQPYKGESEGME